MTTKPEVAARSSVLRRVVSRNPPAHIFFNMIWPMREEQSPHMNRARARSRLLAYHLGSPANRQGGMTGRVLQNYLAANLNLLSKKWRTQRYQRAVLQIMSATIILGAQWGDEGKVCVHCFRSRDGVAIGSPPRPGPCHTDIGHISLTYQTGEDRRCPLRGYPTVLQVCQPFILYWRCLAHAREAGATQPVYLS